MLKWVDVVNSDKELADSTIRKRDGQLRTIYNALQDNGIDFSEISKEFISGFIYDDKKQYSKNTIRSYLEVFNTLNIHFNGSVQLGVWLQKNIDALKNDYMEKKNIPADFLEFYDPDLTQIKAVKILAMFLNNPSTNTLRISDVRRIKMTDDPMFNFIDDDCVLHIRSTATKNKSERDIVLDEDFVDSIFQLAGNDWLIESANGEMFKENSGYLSSVFTKTYNVNHGDARKHNCNVNLNSSANIGEAMEHAKNAGHKFTTEVRNYIDDDSDTDSDISLVVHQPKREQLNFPPIPSVIAFIASDGRRGYILNDTKVVFE